jgi:gliding motility-associated lipoprotein GldH
MSLVNNKSHKQSKTNRAVRATVLLLITVALALAGCNRKAIYSHYEHTELDGWSATDSLVFNLDPLKADCTYSERIGLRANGEFPYQGIVLVIDQRVLPSGKHYVDTLKARLADEDGTFLGSGNNYFQYDFSLRELDLQKGDSLHFCIRHAMNGETLPGISDVGVTVEVKGEK